MVTVTWRSPESADDQFHISSHQSLSMPSMAMTSASPSVDRRTFCTASGSPDRLTEIGPAPGVVVMVSSAISPSTCRRWASKLWVSGASCAAATETSKAVGETARICLVLVMNCSVGLIRPAPGR